MTKSTRLCGPIGALPVIENRRGYVVLDARSFAETMRGNKWLPRKEALQQFMPPECHACEAILRIGDDGLPEYVIVFSGPHLRNLANNEATPRFRPNEQGVWKEVA